MYFPGNLFQLRHLLSFRYNSAASDYLAHLGELFLTHLDLIMWYKDIGEEFICTLLKQLEYWNWNGGMIGELVLNPLLLLLLHKIPLFHVASRN